MSAPTDRGIGSEIAKVQGDVAQFESLRQLRKKRNESEK